jgi:hypothetical protein
MENLVSVEVTEYGTIIEEVEVICTMTGFRLRFRVEYLERGSYRCEEVYAG